MLQSKAKCKVGISLFLTKIRYFIIASGSEGVLDSGGYRRIILWKVVGMKFLYICERGFLSVRVIDRWGIKLHKHSLTHRN